MAMSVSRGFMCTFIVFGVFLHVSRAVPQLRDIIQPPFANTTSTPIIVEPTSSANLPTPTFEYGATPQADASCGACSLDFLASQLVWKSVQLTTTTLTVATVVLSVNNRTNATTTSTIYGNVTATGSGSTTFQTALPTNENGVLVTTVILVGQDSKTTTTAVPFPTVLIAYDPTYTIYGPFETTSPDNSSTFCTTPADSGPLITAFPSHPAYSPRGGVQLPKGNYNPQWVYVSIPISSMLPDAGPIQSCLSPGLPEDLGSGPRDGILTVASFLTETSTTYYHDVASPTSTLPEQTPAQPEHVLPSAVRAFGHWLPSPTPTPPQPTPPILLTPGVDTAADIPTHPVPDAPLPTPETQIPVPDSPAPVKVSLPVGGTEVVIGTSTIPLLAQDTPSQPTPAPAPVITLGTKTLTANSQSQFVVDGQTLAPGGPAITVAGTPLSLAPSASFAVIGTSTVALPAPQDARPNANHAPLVLTLGTSTLTANAHSQFLIAGQTLAPGGPAITLPPQALAPSPDPQPPLLLPLGPATLTANAASQFLIAGQTLAPGGPAITVSGTRLSLAPSAAFAVIGTSTIPLAAPGGAAVVTNPPSPLVLTLGAQTLTVPANAAGQFVVAGQTLTPGGPAITVSGARISLAPSAAFAVIGTSTIPLAAPGRAVVTNPPSPLVLTLGAETLTVPANAAGQFVIAGQTLVPGGPAITVSGTRVSLPLGATAAEVGTDATPALNTAGLVTVTGSGGTAIGGGAKATASKTGTARNGSVGLRGAVGIRCLLGVAVGVVVWGWL